MVRYSYEYEKESYEGIFVFCRLIRRGLYVEIETANNRSIVVGTVVHIYIYIYVYMSLSYTWETLISVKNIYDVSVMRFIRNDYTIDITQETKESKKSKEKREN